MKKVLLILFPVLPLLLSQAFCEDIIPGRRNYSRCQRNVMGGLCQDYSLICL